MFVSLLLAAALRQSWFPGVPYADLVTCPPNHHFPPPPAYSFLPPYLPKASAEEELRRTPTRVSDSIGFPMHGTKWFQSWAGGGGAGTFAVYDPSTGAHGIRFGDTIGDVEVVYGYAKPVRVNRSLWALAYAKIGPPAGSLHVVTDTTFYFRDGRLAGVDRVSGI